MLNVFSEGLFAVTLVAFIILALGSMSMWLFSKLTGRKLSRRAYVVPLAIVFMLTAVLSQKIAWDLQTFQAARARATEQVLEDKWAAIETFLNDAYLENYKLSEQLATDVIRSLKSYSGEELDRYLATLGTSPNNPIQKAVGATIQGVYFRDIVSDENDPFAMVIGKGLEDSFIFADFSENCAVEELTRDIYQEFELQSRAGNRALAENAFNRLVSLHSGKPLREAIFFQFNEKDGAELKRLDFDGLKQTFFENKGDIALTFKSIEFLAPYYIYRDQSIGGTPRVIARVKTDAKVLAVVSVFSFYDVVSNDKSIQIALDGYDSTREFMLRDSFREERTSLVVGILIMLVTILLFAQFWAYTANSNPITAESGTDDAGSSQDTLRR